MGPWTLSSPNPVPFGSPQEVPLSGGSGGDRFRILVVDDDEGCRQGVASLLAEDGHSVLTAGGGQEALEKVERLRRQNQILHVSILDYHMPDWTGTETFRRLLGVVPGLAAVFLSGEFSEAILEEVRLVGGKALLRKPLEILRVRVVVRQLLGDTQFWGS